MDATLRSWRRKLQAEQCLFLVRPPCAAKGCRFEVIVSPMYGCTGCGRTHYCESSVLADKLGGVLVPEQGAGDACEFYVNTEEENVCALSQAVCVGALPVAPRSASYKEFEELRQATWQRIEDEVEPDDDQVEHFSLKDQRAKVDRMQFFDDARGRKSATDGLGVGRAIVRGLHDAARMQHWQHVAVKRNALALGHGEEEEQEDEEEVAAAPVDELQRQLTTDEQRHLRKQGCVHRDVDYWDRNVFTAAYIDALFAGSPAGVFAQRAGAPPVLPEVPSAAPPQRKAVDRDKRVVQLEAAAELPSLVPADWLVDLAELVTAAALPAALVDLLGRWHALIRVTNPKFGLEPLLLLAAYLQTDLVRDGVPALDGAGNSWLVVGPQPTLDARGLFVKQRPGKRRASEVDETEEEKPATTTTKRKKREKKKAAAAAAAAPVPATLILPTFRVRPGLAVRVTEKDMLEVRDKMVKVIRDGRLAAPWFFDWFHDGRRQCWPPLSDS